MFGIANQLIASAALAIGTTLINMGRVRYAWVTFVLMCFVAVTALSAGYLSIRGTHTVKRRPRRLSVERIALILNNRSMYDGLRSHELIPRPPVRWGEYARTRHRDAPGQGLVLNADIMVSVGGVELLGIRICAARAHDLGTSALRWLSALAQETHRHRPPKRNPGEYPVVSLVARRARSD